VEILQLSRSQHYRLAIVSELTDFDHQLTLSLLITSQHGPSRKQSFAVVEVQLLHYE
jgi:hypothetical protein